MVVDKEERPGNDRGEQSKCNRRRFHMSRYATLALLAVLAACSGDPRFTGVPDVREASGAEVATCAYVTDIAMKPGVYGPLADQGLAYARNSIKLDARDAGANTVVFAPAPPGTVIYELRAVAYRC